MSTTIDQRVVEMRFDNKNFENNVQQSMSTLEKLKQKLNLKGASRGLENLNTSANKVNMNGLCSALDVVHSKFSAMEVIGITALANITNSAVNAGKRMVAALTIDPIKTGLAEYETQINAVQTILANTQKEGTNVEIVNKALDELNEYADKTIYNFTEMTRNIGTFTAAGVKLDTSVKAIKGISNLAAVSGSTSQQASTAMYQLSQALSSGTVKLMDWNSVVNAGMGGQVFQDALKETARVHGIAIDKMIKEEGSFRETLKKGWLSSEILTETLEKFTYSAEEGSEAWNEYKKSLMDKGYTEQQATEILKLGNTATEAATKVKTFSQLWSVLKEAAQSGWAQTWRIIIGDFEEAKALFTPLADFFTGPNGIITKMTNARNKLLEGALSFNPFTAMLEKLENSGVGKIAKKVSGISKSLEEYQKVVSKVWRGDYNNRGDNPDRYDLLEKDGWNPRLVQSLVNKGNEYKLTVEDIAEAEKKHGVTAKESVEAVTELSDAQLKNAGFTEDEIRMYRQLEEQSKKTGKSIEEIINEMEKKDGRTLLIESLANAGKGIVAVFKSIGEAWRDAFPPMTSLQLYNIIAGLHSFSEKLVMSEDTSKKLTRTLKGVFAILDLITMVVGGGFKIAFTVLKAVLGAFNLDILEFTAIIGDAIVKFRNWIEEHNYLAIGITKVVTLLIKMGKAVANLVKRLWELPAVQKFIDPIINAFKKLDDITLKDVTSALKSFGKAIKNAFVNINKHFNGVPGDIISGLANGFKDGVTKVITTVVNLAKTIINKFKEILGIHSPSTVFFAIGGFIIAGLIGGLLSGSTDLGSAASGIVDNLKEFFGNIDWSKIFTAGMSAGILLAVKSILDSIRNISGFFGGFGSMFEGVGKVLDKSSKGIGKILNNTAKVVKNFAKVMGAIAFKKTTEGIKNLAVSVLIIAASVALLTKIDQDKMWQAVGAIAALAVILGILSAAIALMSKSSMSISKNGIQVSGVKTALFSIAAAILAMGIVVKLIGGMSPEQVEQGMKGLTKVVIRMGGLILAFGLFVKGDAAQSMDKAGKMVRKMGTTLLLMVLAVKLISLLDEDAIDKGTDFIGGFVVFVGLLAVISNFAGNDIDKVGKAVSKISWALILMVAVVKLVSLLDWGEMGKAVVFLAGFVVFVGALVKVTKIGNDQQIAKVSGLILSISAAMLIMVALVKIISGMDFWAFVGGAAGVAVLGLLIVGLLHLIKLVGPDAPKLAGTILALSVAIGILAAIAVVLSLIKFDTFMEGAKCVGVLAVIMGALLLCAKDAGDAQKTAMSIAIAIGVMAAAIGILSFIDPTKLIAPTIAMAILMGMFALILKSSKNVTNSMKTLLVMTAVIGVLALALGLLSKQPWQNTIGAAISLGILMGLLVGVLALLSKMNSSINSAIPGAVGLLALSVPLIAIAFSLKMLNGVDNAIGSAIALGLLMIAMTALLVVVGKMDKVVAPGIKTLLSLAVVLGLLTLVMVVLSKLNVQAAVGPAIALSALLIAMAAGLVLLSKFTGNLTKAVISLAIMSGAIILIAAIVKKFKGIKWETLAKAGAAIAGLVAIAVVFSALAGLTTGMLTSAAALLVMAGALTVLTPVLMTLGTLSLAQLGIALLALAGAFAVIGVAGLLLGPLVPVIIALAGAFVLVGIGVVSLGAGLMMIAAGLTNLATAGTAGAVVFAASLTIIVTGILALIPLIIQTIGQGIIQFCNILIQAAPAIGSAATVMIMTLVTVFTTCIPTIVNCGLTLITKFLQALASKIPAIVQAGMDIILGLLQGIRDNIGEIVTTGADIVINFIEGIAEKIPDMIQAGIDLMVALIDGLAKGIEDNSERVKEAMDRLCQAMIDAVLTFFGIHSPSRLMAEQGKYIDEGLEQGITNNSNGPVSALTELGEKALKNIKDKFSGFKESGSKLMSNLKSGISSKVGDVKSNISKAMTNFVSAVKNKAKDFKSKGSELMTNLRSGISNKISDVKSKCVEVATKAISGLKDKIKDFKTMGGDMIDGMKKGIKEAANKAVEAAKGVANSALEGAKKLLGIKSPSKEFYKVGNFAGIGFINALNDSVRNSYNAGSLVAESARKGLSNAISKVADVINSDMDTQPTIRPVLDLTDVENGANYLSTMFNNSPSVDVMSNLSAISSGMNTMNQNGVNRDVVSAINNLRKDLGNVGGDTYNVNGITYDDGSNITEAVKTLVRAAKVERRI